jgi:DNA-binding XRE family transcriptional regulator
MISLQKFVSDYVETNNTTKEALAKEAEIGRTSFFSKVKGTSDFTLSEAHRLASIIGCTLDELYAMQQTTPDAA